jgi:hypothetical protein
MLCASNKAGLKAIGNGKELGYITALFIHAKPIWVDSV